MGDANFGAVCTACMTFNTFQRGQKELTCQYCFARYIIENTNRDGSAELTMIAPPIGGKPALDIVGEWQSKITASILEVPRFPNAIGHKGEEGSTGF